MVNIYTLSHPITGEIRYVGKTTRKLYNRLTQHWTDIYRRGRKCHKSCWIISLKNQGLKPKIELLDVVEDEEWEFWEQYWISQCKAWGFRLTNHTAGGDVGGGGLKLPCTSRIVYLYDAEGNYLNEFPSIKSVERFLGISSGNVRASIRLDILCCNYRVSFEKYDKLVFRESRVTKAVLQYDLKGNFLNEYISAREADKQTGISYKNISQAVTGNSKTAGGYMWKFKDVINN